MNDDVVDKTDYSRTVNQDDVVAKADQSRTVNDEAKTSDPEYLFQDNQELLSTNA